MITSIHWFEIAIIVISNAKIFLWISASATGGSAVNNYARSKILVNGKTTFNNGSRRLPRKPPNWMILAICVFW